MKNKLLFGLLLGLSIYNVASDHEDVQEPADAVVAVDSEARYALSDGFKDRFLDECVHGRGSNDLESYLFDQLREEKRVGEVDKFYSKAIRKTVSHVGDQFFDLAGLGADAGVATIEKEMVRLRGVDGAFNVGNVRDVLLREASGFVDAVVQDEVARGRMLKDLYPSILREAFLLSQRIVRTVLSRELPETGVLSVMAQGAGCALLPFDNSVTRYVLSHLKGGRLAVSGVVTGGLLVARAAGVKGADKLHNTIVNAFCVLALHQAYQSLNKRFMTRNGGRIAAAMYAMMCVQKMGELMQRSQDRSRMVELMSAGDSFEHVDEATQDHCSAQVRSCLQRMQLSMGQAALAQTMSEHEDAAREREEAATVQRAALAQQAEANARMADAARQALIDGQALTAEQLQALQAGQLRIGNQTRLTHQMMVFAGNSLGQRMDRNQRRLEQMLQRGFTGQPLLTGPAQQHLTDGSDTAADDQ